MERSHPLKEVRGFQVYDPEKVRRPRFPSTRWDLTKEEVQWFLKAIPRAYPGGVA